EAIDLRAAHQQLQADPGPERIAADPALLGVWVHRLQIIERGGGVGKLAHTIVENALRTADTPEVETQDAEALGGKELVELDGNAILHRAAGAWVAVEDEGDRRAFLGRLLIAAFNTPGCARENHFRHSFLDPIRPWNFGRPILD